MTKVSGVTFSHLATSRLLMKTWLRKFIRVLHHIHTYTPADGSAVASEVRATNVELCSNYAKKVSKRFEEHRSLYTELGAELGIDVGKMAEAILNFLERFEASSQAIHAHFIHGDPV